MSESGGTGDQGPDFKKDMDALVEGVGGLFNNLRDIFEKSREEIQRASRLGKTRLDLLQLEKDRDHFLQKLGEVALGLMRDGAIAHPSLDEVAVKLDALDARRAEYESQVAEVAAEQAAAEAEKAATADGANEADPVAEAMAEVEGTVDAANADVEPAPAKKAPAKKATAKKATAKKAAPKSSPKKSTAKKTTAKKASPKKPKKDL